MRQEERAIRATVLLTRRGELPADIGELAAILDCSRFQAENVRTALMGAGVATRELVGWDKKTVLRVVK
jgi:hypothetical protein